MALKGSTSEAVTPKGAPLAKLLTVATENEGAQMVIDDKADAMLRAMEKTTTRKEKAHEENPVFCSCLGDGGIEPGFHFLRVGAAVKV